MMISPVPLPEQDDADATQAYDRANQVAKIKFHTIDTRASEEAESDKNATVNGIQASKFI